jgi:selenocysteine lyase/cysteine desulfurase
MSRRGARFQGVYLDWAADLHPDWAPGAAEREWLERQQEFTADTAKSWQELRSNVEKTRAAVAKLLHTRAVNNVVFSTGTLGALQLLTQAFGMTREESILFPGDEIVVTDCEFPILYELLYRRYVLRVAPIRRCSNAVEIKQAVMSAMTRNTRLVFFSHVLYRTGVLLPLGEIADAAKTFSPDVLVAVDGSQALGQVDVNLAREHCDFYMGDTHKWLQGPNNVGFLLAPKAEHVEKLLPLTLNPLATAQQYGRERYSCTKSGIVAFAVAAALKTLTAWSGSRHEAVLKNHNAGLSGAFLKRVLALDHVSRYLASPPDGDLRTGIVGFDFGSVNRRVHRHLLSRRVKCTLHEPFIPAALVDQVPRQSVVRLAFSDRWNTTADVDFAAEALAASMEEALEEPARAGV